MAVPTSPYSAMQDPRLHDYSTSQHPPSSCCARFWVNTLAILQQHILRPLILLCFFLLYALCTANIMLSYLHAPDDMNPFTLPLSLNLVHISMIAWASLLLFVSLLLLVPIIFQYRETLLIRSQSLLLMLGSTTFVFISAALLLLMQFHPAHCTSYAMAVTFPYLIAYIPFVTRVIRLFTVFTLTNGIHDNMALLNFLSSYQVYLRYTSLITSKVRQFIKIGASNGNPVTCVECLYGQPHTCCTTHYQQQQEQIMYRNIPDSYISSPTQNRPTAAAAGATSSPLSSTTLHDQQQQQLQQQQQILQPSDLQTATSSTSSSSSSALLHSLTASPLSSTHLTSSLQSPSSIVPSRSSGGQPSSSTTLLSSIPAHSIFPQITNELAEEFAHEFQHSHIPHQTIPYESNTQPANTDIYTSRLVGSVIPIAANSQNVAAQQAIHDLPRNTSQFVPANVSSLGSVSTTTGGDPNADIIAVAQRLLEDPHSLELVQHVERLTSNFQLQHAGVGSPNHQDPSSFFGGFSGPESHTSSDTYVPAHQFANMSVSPSTNPPFESRNKLRQALDAAAVSQVAGNESSSVPPVDNDNNAPKPNVQADGLQAIATAPSHQRPRRNLAELNNNLLALLSHGVQNMNGANYRHKHLQETADDVYEFQSVLPTCSCISVYEASDEAVDNELFTLYDYYSHDKAVRQTVKQQLKRAGHRHNQPSQQKPKQAAKTAFGVQNEPLLSNRDEPSDDQCPFHCQSLDRIESLFSQDSRVKQLAQLCQPRPSSASSQNDQDDAELLRILTKFTPDSSLRHFQSFSNFALFRLSLLVTFVICFILGTMHTFNITHFVSPQPYLCFNSTVIDASSESLALYNSLVHLVTICVFFLLINMMVNVWKIYNPTRSLYFIVFAHVALLGAHLLYLTTKREYTYVFFFWSMALRLTTTILALLAVPYFSLTWTAAQATDTFIQAPNTSSDTSTLSDYTDPLHSSKHSIASSDVQNQGSINVASASGGSNQSSRQTSSNLSITLASPQPSYVSLRVHELTTKYFDRHFALLTEALAHQNELQLLDGQTGDLSGAGESLSPSRARDLYHLSNDSKQKWTNLELFHKLAVQPPPELPLLLRNSHGYASLLAFLTSPQGNRGHILLYCYVHVQSMLLLAINILTIMHATCFAVNLHNQQLVDNFTSRQLELESESLFSDSYDFQSGLDTSTDLAAKQAATAAAIAELPFIEPSITPPLYQLLQHLIHCCDSFSELYLDAHSHISAQPLSVRIQFQNDALTSDIIPLSTPTSTSDQQQQQQQQSQYNTNNRELPSPAAISSPSSFPNDSSSPLPSQSSNINQTSRCTSFSFPLYDCILCALPPHLSGSFIDACSQLYNVIALIEQDFMHPDGILHHSFAQHTGANTASASFGSDVGSSESAHLFQTSSSSMFSLSPSSAGFDASGLFQSARRSSLRQSVGAQRRTSAMAPGFIAPDIFGGGHEHNNSLAFDNMSMRQTAVTSILDQAFESTCHNVLDHANPRYRSGAFNGSNGSTNTPQISGSPSIGSDILSDQLSHAVSPNAPSASPFASPQKIQTNSHASVDYQNQIIGSLGRHLGNAPSQWNAGSSHPNAAPANSNSAVDIGSKPQLARAPSTTINTSRVDPEAALAPSLIALSPSCSHHDSRTGAAIPQTISSAIASSLSDANSIIPTTAGQAHNTLSQFSTQTPSGLIASSHFAQARHSQRLDQSLTALNLHHSQHIGSSYVSSAHHDQQQSTRPITSNTASSSAAATMMHPTISRIPGGRTNQSMAANTLGLSTLQQQLYGSKPRVSFVDSQGNSGVPQPARSTQQYQAQNAQPLPLFSANNTSFQQQQQQPQQPFVAFTANSGRQQQPQQQPQPFQQSNQSPHQPSSQPNPLPPPPPLPTIQPPSGATNRYSALQRSPQSFARASHPQQRSNPIHDLQQQQRQRTFRFFQVTQNVVALHALLKEIEMHCNSGLAAHYSLYSYSLDWKLLYYRIMTLNHWTNILYMCDLTEDLRL